MENNDLDKQGFVPAQAAYFSGKHCSKCWLVQIKLPIVPLRKYGLRQAVAVTGTRIPNQILLIKEGCCYYQQDGQSVQYFKVSSTINMLPGIKHWHGASPDAFMMHTAININTEKGTVNWLEPVTDQQYHGTR